MTKKELLKMLESVPDDAIIVRQERTSVSVYNDICEIDDIKVVILDDRSYWAGAYANYDVDRDFFDREGKQPFTVYRIS